MTSNDFRLPLVQGVFDLALLSLSEPFRALFTMEDIGGHNGTATGQALLLKRAIILALRLCRHMLRDNSTNKRYMVRHVPLLQSTLGKGVKVAETLRECFADNPQMLDLVTDQIVGRFVQVPTLAMCL